MQKEIHPKYFDKATVNCSCGNTFIVGSTKETMQIEICSACHPFYTGADKVLDTAGRVERFKARLAKKTTPKVSAKKASK
ncbi:MAG: 50S ribosomal protein L31 [Candidatus Taylorbacteria bacterium RIFCSPHIGHO2_01_FULL_46_22b]|uniref:Large ribosomal subunit protein bL31 n=1 Tax=Candidatus Taylorbacteria bacterium RIFCSPHIGHO2_01_FULL_46_22b TaxID=1802301 RepID=A0A1G2M6D4_9BACT|nr:MAG: 50S ribosomal protein L31 [Candidatus Taylorbacteria bacterium RIFCSPHIGHO2_01_FULL_46_22b]